ncbi:hypothetical protein ACFQJ5_14480 [Halomicroarcula sp. GCM10025324]|uniref:DUF7289 family protein n=1 Tax=Haloarcula TaxID=2237 RepID=UPI0023E78C2C|nr:hypothetical protein [Halomicroarcula sp. ZS-22-S1]
MRDRAVSEVLSFTLVFALVVTSVAIVSVSGLGSLQDARDAEQLENAERAFDVFADNLADLHRQGAPSRATEISLAQAQLATEDNVTMSVEIEDGSASTFTQSWEVRPLVYSGNQDRELVYEAGAVFRTNRDSGIVVREPPLAVNDDRVLFSIIGLNSPQVQSLGGSTVLVRTDHRAADVVYTNTTGGITRFEVTVRSPRSTLWSDYFESNGFTCSNVGPQEIECDHDSPGTLDRAYVVYHDIGVAIDQ